MIRLAYTSFLALAAALLAAIAPNAFALPAPFDQPNLASHVYDPPPSQSFYEVEVLGISRQGNIYITGSFTSVDGQPRARLARLKADGTLDSWSPTVPPGLGTPYQAAEDANGNVAVAFLNNNSDKHLAYIPAATQAGVWIDGEGAVSGRSYMRIAFDDSGALFALVSKDCANGLQTYGAVVRKFAGTSLDATFSLAFPAASSCLNTLGFDGGFVYVGGRSGTGLVRANSATGVIDTTWSALTGALVDTLLPDGAGSVYVVGDFAGGYGARRVSTSGAGAIDPAWSVPLRSGNTPRTMALDPAAGHIYFPVGSGDIVFLAAASTTTGAVVAAWDPGPSFQGIGLNAEVVRHMVVLGDRLFIGGTFTSLGNTARAKVAAVPLASTPVTWPTISIRPTLLDFGTTFTPGAQRSRSFSISNVGAGDLVLQGVSFFLPTQFTQTNTCGTPVPGGGSCTVTVTATLEANTQPAPALFYTALAVTSNGSGTARIVNLASNQAIAGTYAFTPSSLNFPPTAVGASRTGQATLTNNAAAPLEIEGIRAVGLEGELALSHACPAILEPGLSCAITFTWTPKSVRPVNAAMVRVAANVSGRSLFVSGQSVAVEDQDGDGIPDADEAPLGRNPQVKDNDVFASPLLFAMQLYRDFLGRQPESGGAAFWAGRLASGSITREAMIAEFMASGEFEARVSPVTRLYFAYFLRVPDFGGLQYWLGRYRAGESLEAISDLFASSFEFSQRYGLSLDAAQFVDRVYRNVLGRAPDADGLAFWTAQLATMTRGQLMLRFSESPEYRELTSNEVFVTMVYAGMLGRAPDAAGFGGIL